MGSKFYVLFRVQLLNQFGINRIIHSSNKKERFKLVGYAILGLILLVMAVGYSTGAAYGAKMLGLTSALPAIMVLVGSIATLVFTFFKSNGFLFDLKDYDHVMSSPVSDTTIVLSRLTLVYLGNLLINAIITIPAFVMYLMEMGSRVEFIFVFIVVLILMPLIPMVVAMFVSFLITWFSLGFRYRQVVSISLNVILLVAVLGLSFGAGGIDPTKVEEFIPIIEKQVNQSYFISGWLSNALNNGHWPSFIWIIVTSLVITCLFLWVISKNYRKVNTLLMTTSRRKDFTLGTLNRQSAFITLYKKELKRFYSSSIYAMNTGVGAIMIVMLAVVLFFFRPESILKSMELGDINLDHYLHIVPFISLFCSGISNTTSVSMNMEGKNNWLMCTAPVSSLMIFFSKIAVNLTIYLPACLILGVSLVINMNLSGFIALFTFIIPMLFVLLMSLIGLFWNLKIVRYNWENEYQAVKNGANVLLTLLVGMILSFALLFGAIAFAGRSTVYMSVVSVVMIAVIAWMYIRLKKKRIYV